MKIISVLIKVETYPRLQNHFLPRDSLVVVNEWLLLNNLEKEVAREEIVTFVTQEGIGQSRKTWWEVVVVVPKVSLLGGGSSVVCCRCSLCRKCTSSERRAISFLSSIHGSLFFPNNISYWLFRNFLWWTPSTLTIQFSQVHPPKRWRTKKVQFVLPIYSLEHDQTPGSQPLKETWVLSQSHFVRSHQLWRATFQHPYHNF